jgi:hypothetical protein
VFPHVSQTHSLTAGRRVFLEKLIGPQVVKKLPIFYGTWRFITTFTKAHHLSLTWGRWIQSMPSHSITVISHLFLIFQVVPFLHVPPTKPLHAFLFSPIHEACPTHLILLDLIIWINRPLKKAKNQTSKQNVDIHTTKFPFIEIQDLSCKFLQCIHN